MIEEERQGIGSRKEKNSDITQTLCKNYEWKTQVSLRRWWEWISNKFKKILNLIEPDITA